MLNTLESLFKLARDRKSNPIDGSYTNKLLSDKSLSKEKVLEEINELIEAVEKNSNKIHEAADVFYHLIMYLEANDVKIEDVMDELNKRKKRKRAEETIKRQKQRQQQHNILDLDKLKHVPRTRAVRNRRKQQHIKSQKARFFHFSHFIKAKF